MKTAYIFLGSLLPVALLTALNYWQVLHLPQRWSAWAWYTLCCLPAFFVAQIAIYWVWGRGYHDFAQGKMWVVQLAWLAASGIVALVMTRVFFNEWPTRGAVIGAAFWLAGGVIAALWR